MRRESVDQAADRRPHAGFEAYRDNGFEAVGLSVRGGELVAVVPAGTPADQVELAARVLLAELRLEDERVVLLEVRPSQGLARVEDRSLALHRVDSQAEVAPHSPFAGAGARTAGDIMTTGVIAASADMLVEDAAKLLAFHNISGMPVEDWDGSIIGVVTEADVIGKIGATVGDVMSTEVIAVGEAATLDTVASTLSDRRIRRVFVMDHTTLLGVVSRSDLVRAVAESTAAARGSRDAVASR